MISPLAVRELLLNSGWTYHPEHKVFTQFLDLELSPKFWDSARPLPSDDSNFDRLARHMGIPRDTLIEDLEQRTQRMHDEKLEPQKATKINSEKIIFPEALIVWMVRQGWSYDANELCFAKRDGGVGIVPKLTALNVPRPASDPYFRKLAENVGTPHAALVETLYEWSQDFLKSERPEAEVPEEPVLHVPESHVQTVVSALRTGIEYARIALKDLPAQGLRSSRIQKHVTSLMEEDIREMKRALEFLGGDE